MSLAQQLKDQTAAVSFRSHKFGVRRRLDEPTRAQAAQPFQAEPSALVASKCLLDTRAAEFRSVTDVIRRARRFWKSMTVFFPAKGVRLIRRDLIDQFNSQMADFRQELESNVDELLNNYKALKQKAKQDLGQLFASRDYPDPDTLAEEFSIIWGFPSIDPPNYLKELNPKLYEQEQAKVAAKFEEAMATAQQVLAAEMQELIGHLVDKLTPGEDGKKKTLNDKALKGLSEFVERFRQCGVHSSPELDDMIKQVEQITRGVNLKEIKAEPAAQQKLFSDVSNLKTTLDQMLVDAPDRKIDLEDDE